MAPEGRSAPVAESRWKTVKFPGSRPAGASRSGSACWPPGCRAVGSSAFLIGYQQVVIIDECD